MARCLGRPPVCTQFYVVLAIPNAFLCVDRGVRGMREEPGKALNGRDNRIHETLATRSSFADVSTS